MAAWEYFTSQKQWEAYLKDLLKTNDQALLKSIVLVYDNQTDEEKNKGESIEDNCIGFSKIDAKEMGDIAKKIKADKALTKGELAKSRNKMQKYWKQLMIISKKQAEAKKLQEQKELEDKLAEEVAAIEEEDKLKLEQFFIYLSIPHANQMQMRSFIDSTKTFLNLYYVPGTLPSDGDTAINKTHRKPCLYAIYILKKIR